MEMYEQLDIFSFLPQKKTFSPGEYVEKDFLGSQLTFDEITREAGNLIIMDKSTVSHEWYEIVRVEKIISVEEKRQRRLIYYDGTRQYGLVNEMYFNDNLPYPASAYRIREKSKCDS